MYNEDVKSIAEFPFSWPKSQEIQEELSKGTTPVQETLKKDRELPASVGSRTSLEEPQVDQEFEENQESDKLKSSGSKEDEERLNCQSSKKMMLMLNCHQKSVIFSQENGFLTTRHALCIKRMNVSSLQHK
jgi:hypothetical protein